MISRFLIFCCVFEVILFCFSLIYLTVAGAGFLTVLFFLSLILASGMVLMQIWSWEKTKNIQREKLNVQLLQEKLHSEMQKTMEEKSRLKRLDDTVIQAKIQEERTKLNVLLARAQEKISAKFQEKQIEFRDEVQAKLRKIQQQKANVKLVLQEWQLKLHAKNQELSALREYVQQLQNTRNEVEVDDTKTQKPRSITSFDESRTDAQIETTVPDIQYEVQEFLDDKVDIHVTSDDTPNFDLEIASVMPQSLNDVASDHVEITFTSNISSSTNESGARWYRLGESCAVQEYEILDGMIYVGKSLTAMSGYGQDASLINPAIHVTPAEPSKCGEEMGYYPQYANIPAKCRGAYLKWLTTGRSDPHAHIGFVFMFFYGLERRLLYDLQKDFSEIETIEIINEIKRLLDIYGENHSFQNYATNFLGLAHVLIYRHKPLQEIIDYFDQKSPVMFQFTLARCLAEGMPIPASCAFQWVKNSDYNLRTPARRCKAEFEKLFACYYKKKYGEGMVIKPNKTALKLQYFAASPSFSREFSMTFPDLPNPLVLTRPLDSLIEIANLCTTELESYSRYRSRKENTENSLPALALLPPPLIETVTGAEEYKHRLERLCQEQTSLCQIGDIYAIFGEKTPLRMNQKDAENIACVLDSFGYGMAPDVRCHCAKPSCDEKIAIYKKAYQGEFKQSREFHLYCTILRLGATVAQIDGDVAFQEEMVLKKIIEDNSNLAESEKQSLHAFLYWALNTPQSLAGIKQNLANASLEEKSLISRFIISVAHADGRIDPLEVKQLEKLYSLLGIDKNYVTRDLHEFLLNQDQPVLVAKKDIEPSYAIPKSGALHSKQVELNLNQELVKFIQDETRRVKGVLENIFTDTSNDNEPDIIVDQPAKNSEMLASLDVAHQNLLQKICTQESWERATIFGFCKELGIMIDGAFETLNEWSFNCVNAPLIEDGEPNIYVDIELAREIINA